VGSHTRLRAWWEGKTLVVDTANFSHQSNFMGSAENLHMVERFTRVAPGEIAYEIVISDPTTWTKPWTVAIRLKQTEEKIYEFACHEGNFCAFFSAVSTACQNPSLTYMALTARACDYAVSQMKKGEL